MEANLQHDEKPNCQITPLCLFSKGDKVMIKIMADN